MEKVQAGASLGLVEAPSGPGSGHQRTLTALLKDACPYDRLPVEDNIVAIKRLKQEKNALILCHTYQRPEVHEIADVVGDSYALAMAAKKANRPVVVFCGVHFMAETASILNPEKAVYLPSLEAGCGLADSITAEQAAAWKAQHPGKPLVLYINSSADVKAEADIICTSANTLRAVEAAKGNEVLLAPDKNLYFNTQPKTAKKIIPWEGYCPVHKQMTPEMLEHAIGEHPNAEVLVHPECNPEVTELADKVLSTTGMVDYVRQSTRAEFIIGTEVGLVQMLQTMFPEKRFYSLSNPKSCDESCVCPFMKAITIGKVRRCLESIGTPQEKYRITVSEETRKKAVRGIEAMLALGRDN